MGKLTDDVFKVIEPVLTKNGFEIVDIEFKKKYGQDNLTVFIYKEGGISLTECEEAHNLINPVLDELNPTNDKPYVLNVSSPGLDRPFKIQRDFERNYGNEVEVKLYAPLKGKKTYEGVLLNHNTSVTLLQTGEKETQIENTRIAAVLPLIKFNG